MSSNAEAAAAAAAADGLPAKPGSTALSPNEIIAACKQAKAAAQANARIRPATFVLPAGGPDEEAAPEQRMPQGKGRPQAGDASDGLARKQVLEAAALRQKEAKAAQAALEAQRAAQHAQRKAALDQQAQGIKQQQEDSKKKLAAALAQQIRDKQGSNRQQAQGAGGALLINPPDQAAVISKRVQQQAEYRQQLAAKASMQQQLKAQDTQRALAELEVVQQSLVASVQAARSSRQQAAEAVRRDLGRQGP
ncbi:hypothetical protein OEZ86_014398 [Tetradesmus obliquus]|nr:hypothetical protein OEZ86_014398 [Tetradesmus obliquus]